MALGTPSETREPGIASDIAGAWNLFESAASGTPRALVSAGTTAAKLGANVLQQTGVISRGTAGTVGGLAADVANLANIYTGIQQGGVTGYGGAAVNAAQLASRIPGMPGAGPLGQVAAPLASALSVYNFAKGWQSGKTGADALSGAQMGATIGTEILPGVGTLIGGAAGAAFGAVSSLFGGGAADPETMGLNNYVPQYNANPAIASQLNPAQNYQLLSGIMDAKNNSPGHSTPQEQYYGRMAESAMMNDVFSQVNSALKSGKIAPNATPQQIYQQVVDPYWKSKGMGIQPGWPYITSQGNNFGNAMQAAVTNLIGQWQKGQLTSQSQIGIEGQTDPSMPAFGGQGIHPQTQQTQQSAQQTMQQQVGSAVNSLGNILGGQIGTGQQLMQQFGGAGAPQQQPQLGGSGTYLDNSMNWLSTLGQQTW
jgi:hypothetical protein